METYSLRDIQSMLGISKAVIGGLICATVATLFFVPVIFSIVHARARREAPAGDLLYLPPGHDPAAAVRLRAIGWRTRAALGDGEDPASLGCTHTLDGNSPKAL